MTVAIHPTTETIELPSEVVKILKAQAKRSQLSVTEYLMQWLEDRADCIEAEKRLQLLDSGKTTAIPWAVARAQLMQAP